MELILYKMLYILKEEEIFDASDAGKLADVIIFEYVDTCGVVNGKYEIKETLTSGGQHISYDTTAIRFKVNLCPNFFVLRDVVFYLSEDYNS